MGRFRLAGDERGAAAVEFALIAVLVLIPLLLGIMEFGRAFNAQLTLQHAVREGARAYAIHTLEAVGVDAADEAWRLDDPNSPPPQFSGEPGGVCEIGDNAAIHGVYDFQFVAPFIPTIIGGDGTLTLRATGVMRCGG